MKKIYIIILLFATFIFNINAQMLDKNCYYGITFELSENTNWGYGELVITDVEPNSPAEQAGIKIGDIIMEINGKATYLRDNTTIASWLFDVYDPTVKFTIRNMNTYFKEYELVRRCINSNSVSEQQLSSIFSFYSLEDTNNQTFNLPLSVTPKKDIDFTDYHTYDFYKEEESNVPPIDAYITKLLDKELQSKGLIRNTVDPDIIIQSYYSYVPNTLYTGLNEKPNVGKKTLRYDNDKQQIVTLPISYYTESDAKTIGQYVVEFGFSFYDKKYINPSQLTQIWDCNIKEYFTSKYSLEEYVRINTPLMLMQFPYTTVKKSSKYEVSFNKFNYTGLYFNADDLASIKDVIPQSPAHKSGIRAGYTTKKLNDKKFNHTKKTLSDGYKQFIVETMVFRDQDTRFTNPEGYGECMFWNKIYYADVAKAFLNPTYITNFSYLYDFNKYINNKTAKDISFEMWDGVQTRIFHVTPEVRRSATIKIVD